MPFAETHVVDERTRFIEDAHRSLRSFTELCERYGISRKTGYKWLRRWQAHGPPGLEDRSTRPWNCPWAVSPGSPSGSSSSGSYPSSSNPDALSRTASMRTCISSTSALTRPTSDPSGWDGLLNTNAASSTPSVEGKDELAAPAKDGELLPRSLDSLLPRSFTAHCQVQGNLARSALPSPLISIILWRSFWTAG
jgi:transposase-like protein